jgi:hypothetical protein
MGSDEAASASPHPAAQTSAIANAAVGVTVDAV